MWWMHALRLLAGNTVDQVQNKLAAAKAKKAELESNGRTSGPEWDAALEEVSLQAERLEIVTRKGGIPR